MNRSFDELVAEARATPFEGWDFGYLKGRYLEGRPSWDYPRMLAEKVKTVRSYLDLGTGGGELVAGLGRLPETCCVTEAYGPNVRVALRNLSPMGADVVFNFSDDNVTEGPQRGALPFRAEAFDLVSNRHEAFVAGEVAKVLRPGGTFLTQQVGEGNDQELVRLLGVEERVGNGWHLAEAMRQVQGAGLKVIRSGEEALRSRFMDVGALAYYLKAAGPLEFEADASAIELGLREADAKIRADGAFEVTTSRFYLSATKPE